MKKLLALLLLGSMAGCMSNNPQQANKPAMGNGKPSADVTSETKLAEKLPLVTAESVTPENGLNKAKELADELNRDAKRMAAAHTATDKQ